MHKIYGYSDFHIGKSNIIYRFSVKQTAQCSRKWCQNVQLSNKNTEKVALAKTYRLRLEFNNIDRQTENVIRRNFILTITHTNFMHFRQKISFKSALESYASFSGHLRTALRNMIGIVDTF